MRGPTIFANGRATKWAGNGLAPTSLETSPKMKGGGGGWRHSFSLSFAVKIEGMKEETLYLDSHKFPLPSSGSIFADVAWKGKGKKEKPQNELSRWPQRKHARSHCNQNRERRCICETIFLRISHTSCTRKLESVDMGTDAAGSSGRKAVITTRRMRGRGLISGIERS